QRASFADIENLFSELSGRDLSDFFAQWVNRTGAPQLEVAVEELNGNRARIMFAQTQFEEPYSLKVPVALFYEGESDPQIYFVSLTQKTEGVIAEEFDRLQSVLVDPFFDVFRSLDIEETPPTVGALFGADEIAFVLPSENKLEWSRLAESFAEGADFELIDAETLEQLPSNRSVWVLGNDNPFVPAVSSALDAFGVAWEPNEIHLADSEVPFENRSTVLVGRHPENPDLALGWIHIDELVAMSGLIEKLPHYGKYSYLSFTGEEPTNDVKGIWASADSPLRWVKPELDSSSIAWERLVPPPAIAELPPKYLPEQLARHTNVLTDAVMQGRGLGSDGLARAGHYIAEQFREAGLQPVGGTYIQPWRQEVPDLGQVTMANVMGMIPGSDAKLSSEPVVLGAHYDHLGTNEESGEFFPGADDNASGISVLIEVARNLARAFTPQRPILFVAFTGEESGLLGSDYFVNSSPDGFQLSSAFAMVNLDAVGRLEGRTLQIFGTESAYEWPFMAQGIGFTTGISSQFAAQTVASSDHVSFLNAGIPAIHLFSGTHLDYNQPTDTADKLDLAGMADVALWVEEAIVYLADRSDPLRVSLEQASQLSVSTSTTAREAVLGTVPDFAYQGQGIRISDVSPGGAAELAGLQARDVILQFNGQALGSLQTYSNMLRAAAPGDEIELTVRRGEQTLNFSAILQTR
ncbi:MAG: M20/M25/M40 family metallo-hydrolase, partial [Pseudomonadota bacterium]|nr:M20/M25/M40 family metallo-hydrolase [Pseudomonadota bacterium]